MKQFCCSGRVLWLGLVLSAFSQDQESKPRKLCGRHLLVEITKLCGQIDWSQFEMDDQTPLTHLAHHSLQTEVKTFSPDQIPSSAWGRFTNLVPISASLEKAINTWEPQVPPYYQFENSNLLPEKTEEFSSRDVHPNVERVKLQEKRRNKINAFSSLFWGLHPQRKRRGFSDKCCLKGCTREELAVACLPYVDF
ncbi:insulin-like peptide INSL6 [Alexandromys fortis]|uniref:insulin-like peptide INSL6 n=1 Tax=Alexandromys fortis TaxID=100897 RepID=UPI002152FA27|nr:insulin-like peptide INSL6 [Microtus fortis]